MPETKLNVENAEQKAPIIDGFMVKGTLTGSLKQLADALRTITSLEADQEKEAVEAAYIEKRDINKAPYLFSILHISKDEIKVVFSTPSGIAPHKRKLDVAMYLLNILSVMEPNYAVDLKVLYQLVESLLKELYESVTPDYAKLYIKYDTLKKEVDELRKRNKSLDDENQLIKAKNFELKTRNDELEVELKKAETVSDEAIKSNIQEWIVEHDGEINVYEFCKTFKVTPARVEQMLTMLVNDGYLETVK